LTYAFAITRLFDGLMGTAQSQLSNQGVPTAIEALASQGSVARSQMGYALGRVADGNNQGYGLFAIHSCMKLSLPLELLLSAV
jgi:hypothetical protein